MATYFTESEFLYSKTAIEKGILNIPNDEQKKNIQATIEAITPLRIAWGAHVKTKGSGLQGININSGFRVPELNKEVGGVSTSAHTAGWAADLYPANGDFEDFKKFVRNFFQQSSQRYDQIIIEKNSKGAQWVHFGLYNLQKAQRMSLFSMDVV